MRSSTLKECLKATYRLRRSMLVKVLELSLWLLLARRDVTMGINLDGTDCLHLLEELPVLHKLLIHLVEVGQLLLCLSHHRHLRLEICFSIGFGQLVLLDLLPGPSPLAGDLHHIGRHALGDCRDR